MNPVKINDTTYEMTLPRGDKVEIGDREAADFKPHLKLSRWEGESFIKVSLPTAAQSSPVIEGEKVGWVEADLEARFYPLEPTVAGGFTQNELGGFEFEIILKKKPPTNQIVLDIETQGLKYHYQPPLTPEEIAEGAVRPDNVAGSYAVYHESRGNMHASQADAEKYKCGKAFHIYRPKIIDASGKECWADLRINGKLTITIPQDFLDKAVYPVAVDPTFGYESVGSTEGYSNTKDLYNTKFQTGVAGTGVSVSKYCQQYDSYGEPFKLCIYEDDSGEPGDYLATTGEIAEPPASWAWITENLTTSPSLTASTDYWLGTFADNGMHHYRYDTGAATRYKDTGAYPAYPDPAGTGYTAADRSISIYATYTVGGGATEKSSSDSGTGADSLPGRDIALPEAGSGVDALVSLQTPAAKTASDTGYGVDALVSLQMPAAKTASDAGSGVEAFIARLLAAAETGSGAEASEIGGGGLLKHLFASELGEGADGLTAKIEKPNKGGGMRLWT